MSESNGTTKWRDVTKSNKCLICEHRDWCRVSENGHLSCCRRLDTHPTYGSGTKKTDKSGGQFWVFWTGPKQEEGQPPNRNHSEGAANRAARVELDQLYRAFTKLLPVTSEIGKELDRRGVPDDSILRRQCKWLPLDRRYEFAAKLVEAGFEGVMCRTPGFFVAENKKGKKYWTVAGPVGLVIPVIDAAGRVVALLIRPEKSTGAKYLWLTSSKKGGAKALLATHCPTYAGDTSAVRLTEGALKADVATALGGVLCLGLPGLYAPDLLKTLRKLKAKVVRLAFDADANRNGHVSEAMQYQYRRLTKAGFEVQLEQWSESDGKGIDDLLAAGKVPELVTGDAVAEAIAGTVKAAAEAINKGRPQVVIGQDEADVVKEVIKALAKGDERLYQKDGKLAEVTFPAAAGLADSVPKIVPLTTPNIRTRITAAVDLRAFAGKELKPTNPPDWLAPAVRDHNWWPDVRPLVGVSGSPVLRPDGTVHQSPGYDQITGMLYVADREYAPIPESPTLADAKAAVELLRAGVRQFPWQEEVDTAVWLAEVLTIAVRHAILGPCPLFCHTANTAGSGKTQLAKAAAIIGTGYELPSATYPVCGRKRDRAEDVEELRKIATSAVIEGHVAFMLDNVPAGFGFGSSVFDAIITGTTNSDRQLGTNCAPRRQAMTVWVVTGNNVRPVGDTVRRTIAVRLSSPAERPDEVAYTGPEVTDWARQNRGALFSAGLTIAAAYIRAGKPDPGLKPLGSFEAWSGLVRAALVWCGLPDPCSTRGQFVAEDEDRQTVLDLIELTEAARNGLEPVTASEIAQKVREELKRTRPTDTAGRLWTVLDVDDGGNTPAVLAYRKLFPGSPNPDAHRIGNALKRYKGRVVDGKRIEQASKDTHQKVTRWAVISAVAGTVAPAPNPVPASPTPETGDSLRVQGDQRVQPDPVYPHCPADANCSAEGRSADVRVQRVQNAHLNGVGDLHTPHTCARVKRVEGSSQGETVPAVPAVPATPPDEDDLEFDRAEREAMRDE